MFPFHAWVASSLDPSHFHDENFHSLATFHHNGSISFGNHSSLWYLTILFNSRFLTRFWIEFHRTNHSARVWNPVAQWHIQSDPRNPLEFLLFISFHHRLHVKYPTSDRNRDIFLMPLWKRPVTSTSTSGGRTDSWFIISSKPHYPRCSYPSNFQRALTRSAIAHYYQRWNPLGFLFELDST